MKPNDRIAFQAGVDRHIEFGVIESIDVAAGTCVIQSRLGRCERDLKRVRTFAAGVKEKHRRAKRSKVNEHRYPRRLRIFNPDKIQEYGT